jgi:hypothetical protein
MNASIQFVDLAGSGEWEFYVRFVLFLERIAKSLTEGHKFQEAILINSSLTALGKVSGWVGMIILERSV